MASRFWVGGTGTWDAADTTHWAATTGGAGGQSVPGTSDSVTLDASSGGGTVTVNATITVQSITFGAFTGTLDFATNNNNVTLSTSGQALLGSGTGTRTLNMGDGTWTFSGATASVDFTTTTNLTLNANASTIVFSAASPSNTRAITTTGSLTFNNFQVTNQTNKAAVIFGANGGTVTFANINMGASPTMFLLGNLTITGALTFSGSSSSPIILMAGATNPQPRTLTVAAATPLSWATIQNITKAGAGSITATNSIDAGGNTGITISPPSGGGVVGG